MWICNACKINKSKEEFVFECERPDKCHATFEKMMDAADYQMEDR